MNAFLSFLIFTFVPVDRTFFSKTQQPTADRRPHHGSILPFPQQQTFLPRRSRLNRHLPFILSLPSVATLTHPGKMLFLIVCMIHPSSSIFFPKQPLRWRHAHSLCCPLSEASSQIAFPLFSLLLTTYSLYFRPWRVSELKPSATCAAATVVQRSRFQSRRFIDTCPFIGLPRVFLLD